MEYRHHYIYIYIYIYINPPTILQCIGSARRSSCPETEVWHIYIYISISICHYTLCRAVQCRQSWPMRADYWRRPFSTNQRQRRRRLVDSFLTQYLRLKIGENYVFKIIFLTPSKSQKLILRIYSESTWPQASNNGLKSCCSSRNDGEIRCVSEM